MRKKEKVMIIAGKESFMIRVLIEKLEEYGVLCEFVPSKIGTINDRWDEFAFYIYYLEKEEIVPTELKAFLFDRLEDDGKQILIIGEKTDITELQKENVPTMIYGMVARPIDYGNLAVTINFYFEQEKSGELKRNILLVDDDPSYGSLVRDWLMDSYNITVVTSGVRAIKYLGTHPKTDLILLDYEMPVTNGPQVLEMLREDVSTSQIPVIFLTGNDSKESVMAVVALKPEGYLLKSIQREELLNKLKVFFINH
ncbi:MAG: response regulator [Lachnospiraceae bacterium]|nr:response regulator [Lachnospiraceae bacterium]